MGETRLGSSTEVKSFRYTRIAAIVPAVQQALCVRGVSHAVDHDRNGALAEIVSATPNSRPGRLWNQRVRLRGVISHYR